MPRLLSDLESAMRMARMFGSVWLSRHLGTRIRILPFLYLDIVDRCNSRCRSCDIWKIREGSPLELTTEEVLGLRPALQRLHTEIVSIGGGEPTLREDLEECIAGFREVGLGVHMNSNGLAISAERARSLAGAGLNVVYLSCDHPEPEGYKAIRGVNGLHRVEAAIRHFQSLPEPLPVGINTVVSTLNQDVIETMAQRCIDWGVSKAQFIPIHTHLQHREMDRAELAPLIPKKEDLPAIKASIKRATYKLREHGIETNSNFFIDLFDRAYQPVRSVPCMAGTLFVMVNPFGYVVPCYQRAQRLNVREMPLDAIVRSPTYQKQCRSVANCELPCWDAGSAEPSIRFYLPYLLFHPIEIYRQARMHLG